MVTLHFNYDDMHALIAIIQSISCNHILKSLSIHVDVQDPVRSGWSELGYHLWRTGLRDISILLVCSAIDLSLDWETHVVDVEEALNSPTAYRLTVDLIC